MAIKIRSLNNQPSKKKIQIQKCAGLMPVIFHNTANDKKYKLFLTQNLIFEDIITLLTDMKIICTPPHLFDWHFYLNKGEINKYQSLGNNNVCSNSIIEMICSEFSEEECIEISVKLILGGAEYEVEIPRYCTIIDIIDWLISKGVLSKSDRLLCDGLYDEDLGVRYDLYKTVDECNWSNGQVIRIPCWEVCGAPLYCDIILPNSNVIQVVDGPYTNSTDVFHQIRQKTEFHYFSNSEYPKSFFYLYDFENSKMSIMGKWSVAYGNVEEVKEEDGLGYGCRCIRPLQLLRQVVEEIVE